MDLLRRGVFSLQGKVVYYHDRERQTIKRKEASKFVHFACGKTCLNVNLGITGFKGLKVKTLTSKSKANLIVCDMPLSREIIKMFLAWRT